MLTDNLTECFPSNWCRFDVGESISGIKSALELIGDFEKPIREPDRVDLDKGKFLGGMHHFGFK